MRTLLKELKVLRTEGKIHRRLIVRLWILFIICLMLLAFVLFGLFFEGAGLLGTLLAAVVGFIFGRYVFVRMSTVNWDENTEIIQAGKLDMIGYISIGLYGFFEYGARTFLADYFPITATALLFAVIFGTLLGRFFGMLFSIHAVFKENHAA